MKKPEPTPRTVDEIRLDAARAVVRIDRLGIRGTTLCSMREIEAMAMMLVMLGFRPVDIIRETETVEVRSDD